MFCKGLGSKIVLYRFNSLRTNRNFYVLSGFEEFLFLFADSGINSELQAMEPSRTRQVNHVS